MVLGPFPPADRKREATPRQRSLVPATVEQKEKTFAFRRRGVISDADGRGEDSQREVFFPLFLCILSAIFGPYPTPRGRSASRGLVLTPGIPVRDTEGFPLLIIMMSIKDTRDSLQSDGHLFVLTADPPQRGRRRVPSSPIKHLTSRQTTSVAGINVPDWKNGRSITCRTGNRCNFHKQTTGEAQTSDRLVSC